MKIVIGGHWTNPPDGWIALSEQDQDMTKPFPQSDNSVDTWFSEHCIEHLDFQGAISYLKEALRTLKPGGLLRTAWPAIDKLVQFKDGTPESREYARCQLSHYYPLQFETLRELGIDPMNHGQPFLFDSLLKGHNHLFVWSSPLMKEVLERIGYVNVEVVEPGVGPDALERVVRGIDLNVLPVDRCDAETLVIIAWKSKE